MVESTKDQVDAVISQKRVTSSGVKNVITEEEEEEEKEEKTEEERIE